MYPYSQQLYLQNYLFLGGIRFSQTPVNTFAELNRTAFLYCEATYDYGRYDLVYVWKFNDRIIDGDHDPFYRTVGIASIII